MPAVRVGRITCRSVPWPHTLATAPVSKRSTLTVVDSSPSSETRVFCRSMKALWPTANTAVEPGPVSMRSPVAMVSLAVSARPLRSTSPRSSTMLLRDWACAVTHPPAAAHAAAACSRLRRRCQRNSSSVRPSSWGGGAVSWAHRAAGSRGLKAIPEDEHRAAQDHRGHHHGSAHQQTAHAFTPRPSSSEMMLITSAPSTPMPSQLNKNTRQAPRCARRPSG